MCKIIHLVSSALIRTYDQMKTSLLPKPLGQGFCPSKVLSPVHSIHACTILHGLQINQGYRFNYPDYHDKFT